MKKYSVLIFALVVLLTAGTVFTTMANKSMDVNPIDYFEVEGAKATLKDESLDFSLTKESATIKFKNPLAASGFKFEWNGVDDKDKKLENLSLTLTDSEDENVSVKVSYEPLTDLNSAVKFNEVKTTYMTGGSAYVNNASDLTLIYNSELMQFTDGLSAFQIDVDKCLNGATFDGFKSMGVMLEIEVQGKKGATFSLVAINDQSFGKEACVDRVEPMLCLQEVQKKVPHNSVMTLPAAEAYDVYQTESSLTLTVKDPDGDTVKDVNGKVLEDVDGRVDYDIKFTKYGQYRIVYIASDGENKTRGVGYQINVNDNQNPVIILDEKLPSKIKVGEEFSFPKVTIEDNVEGDITSWVSVKHPRGIITYNEGSFVPEEEGTYRITFNALDAQGNIGRLVVTIYAEGGEE